MTEIKFISELTGSGKTGHILDIIAGNDKPYIIAVPNKTLCKEIQGRLKSRGVEDGISVINTDTAKTPSILLGNVIKNPKQTRIIITTHVSYLMGLKDGVVGRASNWNIIIDEEFMFFKNHEFNVSELSKDVLEKTIKVVEYDEVFYQVKAKSQKLWNDIIIGKCDETFLNHPEYVELVKLASSDVYTTLIPKENYEAFMCDKADLSNGKFKKFYAMSICNEKFFSSFKSFTVLCSHFQNTISYKLMKWMGLTLSEVHLPGSRTAHSNSENVTIHYYCNSNWSNTLKNRVIDHDGQTVTLEEYIKKDILNRLGGKPFIYNANVDFRDRFRQGKLVTNIHGVNRYIEYTNMVFMSSLNATAPLVNVLSYFGLGRKDIDFSRNVLQAYQFLSRGAIRKLNNEEIVNLYVMDKRTVDFLLTVLPRAKVEYHDAQGLLTKKRKKKVVPRNVSSFVSRVNGRIEKGERVRDSTLEKYKNYMEEYYR